MRIDAAISKVLADNNAKHADLLSGKFDREKLIVAEDGTVSGLDEQMKGLKESYKDLFGATVSGRTPANPERVCNRTSKGSAGNGLLGLHNL